MNRPYESHSETDLRGLLALPQVGDAARERIMAELALREPAPAEKPKARRGAMNKTETALFAHLRAAYPEEQGWHLRFEAIKLRLADGAWYTPDFVLSLGFGGAERMYEAKGFWREAARVRIKVAAKEFPEYEFVAVQKRKAKDGGGWKFETIKSREREEWLTKK